MTVKIVVSQENILIDVLLIFFVLSVIPKANLSWCGTLATTQVMTGLTFILPIDLLDVLDQSPGILHTVGAASQLWSNEKMMVYFRLMMLKCSLMMVKCSLMMVKCLLMMVKCSSMMVK